MERSHHTVGLWLLVLCLLTSSLTRSQGSGEDRPSYIAAVYEHKVILNPEPHVRLSRAAALDHMRKNLDIYEEQAGRAARQGVQILVFPEDGIHGFNFSRSSISGYLETVPDPEEESWNPCTQPARHNNTEVLQRLSCMARRHSLYLVANMPDLQPCTPTPDPSTSSCPADGRWQFNTNVVFRSDGQLVARYHKHNLYFERAFHAPPSLELRTFDTPFAGRFGLLICFDLLFHDPTVALIKQGVRQLVYPTAWMNQLPLLATVQYQRAFSLGHGVSILGANIRSDTLGMTGSGIFSPEAAVHHHARPGEPEEGRLLVATVPVLDPLWLEKRGHAVAGDVWRKAVGEGWPSKAQGSGFCEQENPSCQEDPPPPPPHLHPTPASVVPSDDTFAASMMYDPFRFVLLRGPRGEQTACDGAFCCRLQYRMSPQGGDAELYALGAFAGTHTVNGRYALQVCALVRCAGSESSSCGQPVEEAESRVDFLLQGRFDTPYVYPSVLASGLLLEQPKQLERTADGEVTLKHSGMTAGLVTTCLYGRMYDLDRQ